MFNFKDNQKEQNILDFLFFEENEFVFLILESQIQFSSPLTQQQIIQQGYLYINSKSFVFQPYQEQDSAYKFLYKGLKSQINFRRDKIQFEMNRITEIKRAGPLSQFVNYFFKKEQNRKIVFQLLQSSILELEKIDEWIQICQNMYQNDAQIEDPKYNGVILLLKYFPEIQNEISNLGDYKEKIQIQQPILVQRILPLVEIYCYFTFTNKYIYFKEIIYTQKKLLKKIQLKSIQKIIRKRYQLEQVAIEFETDDGKYLFNFRDKEKREIIYKKIVKLIGDHVAFEKSLSNLTSQWVDREISNYEYLMNLNKLAQRSKNDLTQYPVFPWLLINFDSKEIDIENPDNYRNLSIPIGALNIERLDIYKKRFNSLPKDQRFFYGTHYSAPGYVIGYLLRSHPLYMLHLQGGKFDTPDRLFFSIKKDWKNCYQHQGCVKELIPEFYENDTSFLKNNLQIEFGIRQNNKKVNNVKLPKWAKDAQHYLDINQQALESEYVSNNLHNWIDLIFGYKQKGREAEESYNLFLPSSYEGEVQLSLIQNTQEKRALRAQINEYGQTPKQLFNYPHPQRKSKIKLKKQNQQINKDNDKMQQILIQQKNLSAKLNIEFEKQKNLDNLQVQKIDYRQDTNELLLLYKNGFLKIYNNDLEKQRAYRISNSYLQSMIQLENGNSAISTVDSKIIIYNDQYGKKQSQYQFQYGKVENLHYLNFYQKIIISLDDYSLQLLDINNDLVFNCKQVIEDDQKNKTISISSKWDNQNIIYCLDEIGDIKIFDLRQSYFPIYKFQTSRQFNQIHSTYYKKGLILTSKNQISNFDEKGLFIENYISTNQNQIMNSIITHNVISCVQHDGLITLLDLKDLQNKTQYNLNFKNIEFMNISNDLNNIFLLKQDKDSINSLIKFKTNIKQQKFK